MNRKLIFALLGITAFLGSCSNDNFIDTGISVAPLDKTMYEYFKSDSYNWDSLVRIIDRGQVRYLFDGTDNRYKNITFFGPTNFSIVRWMKRNGVVSIDELSAQRCSDYVKKYVVENAYLKSQIDFEIKGTTQGGTEITKFNGTKVRAFRTKSDWGSVADGGPVSLYVESYAARMTVKVASPDIRTQTGVVHSLSYTYTFGEF